MFYRLIANTFCVENQPDSFTGIILNN